jgi:hypothetical protein
VTAYAVPEKENRHNNRKAATPDIEVLAREYSLLDCRIRFTSLLLLQIKIEFTDGIFITAFPPEFLLSGIPDKYSY